MSNPTPAKDFQDYDNNVSSYHVHSKSLELKTINRFKCLCCYERDVGKERQREGEGQIGEGERLKREIESERDWEGEIETKRFTLRERSTAAAAVSPMEEEANDGGERDSWARAKEERKTKLAQIEFSPFLTRRASRVHSRVDRFEAESTPSRSKVGAQAVSRRGLVATPAESETTQPSHLQL